MKKRYLYLFLLAACSSNMFAQGEMDALKMGQTDILGTARFMSMGGAFGALGGDASAIGVNPAGLGIYRKSEVSVTPSVMVNRTESETPTVNIKDHRTTFNVNNFATIFNFKGKGALKSSSFSFIYNRRTNYRRNMNAFYAASPASLSDYMSLRTNELGMERSVLDQSKYAFNGDVPYLSDLAWWSGMIVPATDKGDCKQYNSFLDKKEKTDSRIATKEKGGINQMDFSYGANINDWMFLGASLGVYNINYKMESFYTEDYGNGGYFRLSNQLRTTGAGVDFKFGTIVAPADFLRIGFAFHTPTWYSLEDDAKFSAEFDTGKKGNVSTVHSIDEYDYRTPYKIVGSLGFVIAKKAIISADYEMADFSKIEYDTPDDDDYRYHHSTSPEKYWKENELIGMDFKKKHTVRVGAELRVTDNWSVRLGYAFSTSPFKEALENDLDDEGKRANVIYTAGTTPAYSMPQDNMYFTGGFGYHKDFFFVDFAYALNYQKENYYMFFDKSNRMSPVSLTSKRHFAVCTLGFKL